MKKIFFLVIMLTGIAFIFPYIPHAKQVRADDNESPCGGKERWNVKVLNDNEAKSINLTPKISSVHELANLKISPLKQGHDVPRQDFEKQVYTIKARVEKYKHESDADLHLVAIDPDTKETMIIESPDPDCKDAEHSGHSGIYKVVRHQIASYTAKSKKSGWSTMKSGTYEITGVLFQDFIHGQSGVAPNGIELHPILDFKKVK